MSTRGKGLVLRVVPGFLCAALFGCYSAADGQLSGQPGASGAPNGGPPAIDPKTSGLPCDVSVMLERYCIACHSLPPAASVPIALISYEDLSAMRGTPPRTVAALALQEMQGGEMPPPPAAPPSAAEVAIFASWLQAGMPRTTCDTPIDAGPRAPNPYDTPLQCSSGRTWTRGDRGSPEMHPGAACIDCHTREREGPRFSIAGTAYRTAHEPNDCFGGSAAGAPIVQITDARGEVIQLQVNAAGNFFYEDSIALPYSAKVIAGGKERAMIKAQTIGDCNSCHTESGINDAPGRIMLP